MVLDIRYFVEKLKMRLLILLSLMLSMQVFAATEAAQPETTPLEKVLFEGVQQECRQVGGITFGTNTKWSYCHVTRGRWVATIDFLDLYQAQYCLGNTPKSCEQTAQVIFANRAYTPDATVLLVRIDEAGTIYSDPIVVNSEDDSVMSIDSRDAAKTVATQYFVWRADRWVTLDAKIWQHDLQEKLPKGISARNISTQPDLEYMSAEVKLFNAQDADCCPTGGVATVAFGLQSNQFTVKNLTIQP